MSDVKEVDPRNPSDLDDLYRRHSAWLNRRLRAHVDPDQASDTVQETYLRIAGRTPTSLRHPKAFLLRVAMNLIRDQARRSRRSLRRLESPTVSEAPSQIDEILLKQILAQMPGLYRDVFVMHRFSGMSYGDIARARGLSVKAVEWRMARALEYCMCHLGD